MTKHASIEQVNAARELIGERPDFETRVREAIAALPHELTGYAARAAMIELQDNWQAALGDGAKPAALIEDVNLVILLLTDIRNRIS
jgi:hypothetical protein